VSGGAYVPGADGSYTDGTFVDQNQSYFNYSSTKGTYSGGVNYTPLDRSLLYVKYSTGFVSGGSIAGLAFAPETVGSWEAGIKSDLLDSRLAPIWRCSTRTTVICRARRPV
jgi:iron complex outermembrane receptor protein